MISREDMARAEDRLTNNRKPKFESESGCCKDRFSGRRYRMEKNEAGTQKERRVRSTRRELSRRRFIDRNYKEPERRSGIEKRHGKGRRKTDQ
ncbi:MAG: hypothetical protein ABIJ27_00370 [Candidatus Omnitrophota bacterium]